MTQNKSIAVTSGLNSDNIPSIVFVYGDEEYLINRFADEILSVLLEGETAAFNFDSFDGENSKIESIIDVCRQFPMMSTKRVVLLKNIEKIFPVKSKKDIRSPLLESYFTSPVDTTVFLVVCNDLLKSSKNDTPGFPYNFLLKAGMVKKFAKLSDNELQEWIISEFQKCGKKIAPEAARYLSTVSVTNLREISGEIDKICLYSGNKTDIDLSLITEIAGHSKEYNVFELQKEVGRRNTSKAIEILQKILAVNRHEVLITGTLTKFFMSLWKILEEIKHTQNKADIARNSGVPYFFIDEYLTAIRKYQQTELDNVFFALTDADIKLKSTQIDSRFVLEQMLIKITG